MWDRKLGDAYTYVALEFGTYPPDQGLKALRAIALPGHAKRLQPLLLPKLPPPLPPSDMRLPHA